MRELSCCRHGDLPTVPQFPVHQQSFPNKDRNKGLEIVVGWVNRLVNGNNQSRIWGIKDLKDGPSRHVLYSLTLWGTNPQPNLNQKMIAGDLVPKENSSSPTFGKTSINHLPKCWQPRVYSQKEERKRKDDCRELTSCNNDIEIVAEVNSFILLFLSLILVYLNPLPIQFQKK